MDLPGFTLVGEAADGARSWRLGPAGPGRPLILLPGIEGDARSFLRQLPLAQVRPVFALDLPRKGDRLASFAAALLPRLPGEGPVDLFGASLGGLVGRALAELAPARIARLATLGTLPHPSLIPRGLRLGRKVLGSLPGPAFSAWYRRRIAALYREEEIPPELAHLLIDGLPDRPLWAARIDAVLAWGLAPRVGLPLLCLRGQVDREAPWNGSLHARLLPEAGFETVPGGHRAWITHPGALNETLRRQFGQ